MGATLGHGGLALAALAALASMVETFWLLVSAGNFYVRPGSFLDTLLFTLGVFRIFVLPLALVLLGVAVWRSGALGRWSALPVVLGVLTSPLLVVALSAAVYLAVYLSGPWYLDAAGNFDLLTTAIQLNPLAKFSLLGAPYVIAGAGWALLGYLLWSGGSARGNDHRENVEASPQGT